ncbi:RCC1 domain-containing protein 1 isoform X1 [Melopsittacus undulatus]|uniref:RCC1 domain-containing protein 1 isoform X1 n=1 Tax=Melopsittacus undulatus TaxID=13146 RepID=UPI00146AB554|nr:RCC1 domain-containing protein 1 isoform X1 [Melopsittacus undulatus]
MPLTPSQPRYPRMPLLPMGCAPPGAGTRDALAPYGLCPPRCRYRGCPYSLWTVPYPRYRGCPCSLWAVPPRCRYPGMPLLPMGCSPPGAGTGGAPPRSRGAPVGAGLELRSAGRRQRLRGWREALPSETHVVLRGAAAARAWRRGAGLRSAAWSRFLPRGPAPRPLPLLPGGFALPRPPFYRALPAGLRARSLALGTEHVLLLGTGGDVHAWGGGRHGQLGHGTLESEAQPRLVEALAGVPMAAVAAGGWHSASVSEAGDLYMWGWNESGQLALPCKALAEERAQGEEAGAGAAALSPCPEPPEAEATTFISIQALPALLDLPQEPEVSGVSCGSRHTAAVTRGGELYTWGWGPHMAPLCCLQVNTGSWDTGMMPAPTAPGAWSTWWHRGCGQRQWCAGPGPPMSACGSPRTPPAPQLIAVRTLLLEPALAPLCHQPPRTRPARTQSPQSRTRSLKWGCSCMRAEANPRLGWMRSLHLLL